MPKHTLSVVVIKRMFKGNGADYDAFMEEYSKFKKNGKKEVKIGAIKITKRDIEHYNKLGKEMTLQDIAKEMGVHINTAERRMGRIALNKLKKL